ncbi:MAG: ribokinase [Gaiellaceae bacterium]|nr:ribokinase [Gaiellaceae bacterium]
MRTCSAGPWTTCARLPPELGVVGSVNLDFVVRCERLPQPGESLTDATFERHPGGKGANQAVAAARLGADVTFAGNVGDDDLADEALAGLRAAGVNGHFWVAGDTGVAFILVDRQGETEIVVAPGANADPVTTTFPGNVLCQLEVPVESVERAAETASRFFLNAAPAKLIPAELVRAAEIVIVNRYELEALPEAPRLTALTLGAEGAVLLKDGEEIARARPPHVSVVDGTAAGDAFSACLVVTRLEGYRWEEALERACVAGAIAASRPGAQPSLPTAAEVDAMLAP